MINVGELEERLIGVLPDSLPPRLYRIMPLRRLIDSLRHSNNTLVSPVLWGDPYEAAQLRVKLTRPMYADIDGSIKFGVPFVGTPKRVGVWYKGSDAVKHLYCQCWSATKESDTMWRAYTNRESTVKVEVDPLPLLKSLIATGEQGSAFLGRVEYVDRQDLDATIANGRKCYGLQRSIHGATGLWGAAWAKSLLWKRVEFREENEFRLIFVRSKEGMRTPEPPPVCCYQADLNELIREVVIDPRQSSAANVADVIRRSGYRGPVRQSDLYSQPRLDFWDAVEPG